MAPNNFSGLKRSAFQEPCVLEEIYSFCIYNSNFDGLLFGWYNSKCSPASSSVGRHTNGNKRMLSTKGGC